MLVKYTISVTDKKSLTMAIIDLTMVVAHSNQIINNLLFVLVGDKTVKAETMNRVEYFCKYFALSLFIIRKSYKVED